MVVDPSKWLKSRNASIRVGPQYQATLPEFHPATHSFRNEPPPPLLCRDVALLSAPDRRGGSPSKASLACSKKRKLTGGTLPGSSGEAQEKGIVESSETRRVGIAAAKDALLGRALRAEVPVDWLDPAGSLQAGGGGTNQRTAEEETRANVENLVEKYKQACAASEGDTFSPACAALSEEGVMEAGDFAQGEEASEDDEDARLREEEEEEEGRDLFRGSTTNLEQARGRGRRKSHDEGFVYLSEGLAAPHPTSSSSCNSATSVAHTSSAKRKADDISFSVDQPTTFSPGENDVSVTTETRVSRSVCRGEQDVEQKQSLNLEADRWAIDNAGNSAQTHGQHSFSSSLQSSDPSFSLSSSLSSDSSSSAHKTPLLSSTTASSQSNDGVLSDCHSSISASAEKPPTSASSETCRTSSGSSSASGVA